MKFTAYETPGVKTLGFSCGTVLTWNILRDTMYYMIGGIVWMFS